MMLALVSALGANWMMPMVIGALLSMRSVSRRKWSQTLYRKAEKIRRRNS